MPEAEGLKKLLLETNEEYRELASTHHELDDRLREFGAQHYLSNEQQAEENSLKKRKLHIKDRMEAILREHRAANGYTAVSA